MAADASTILCIQRAIKDANGADTGRFENKYFTDYNGYQSKIDYYKLLLGNALLQQTSNLNLYKQSSQYQTSNQTYFNALTANYTSLQKEFSYLQTKWSSQSTYHEALGITVDYSKPETFSCKLSEMNDYLENYNKSKRIGNMTKVLDSAFNEDFYDGD